MHRYYRALNGQERLRHKYIWNVGTAPHTFLHSALDNGGYYILCSNHFNASEIARGTHRLDGPHGKLDKLL
jgi:hypothetical protein